MSDKEIVRRPSYGGSSPDVGRRGARTRRRIIDCSLELYGHEGYFNTSVEMIANAVGVSRATLYQYFPGKQEIFRELMAECGGELLDAAQRISPLGPTAAGFGNLNRWLNEWSWVFDKYSAMFVQWSSVAAAESMIQPDIDQFVGKYQHELARRLAATEQSAIEPQAAAMAVTAIVHRINMYLHTGRAYGKSIHSMVDAASVRLQLMLFPQTLPSVLDARPLRTTATATISTPPMPRMTGVSVAERTASLSVRGSNTLLSLVDAATSLLARNGFNRTSIDDVVAAAGVSRGTFYTYFKDKQDLLLTVSVEAGLHIIALSERLGRLNPEANDRTALREWIATYVQYDAQFNGFIDMWTGRTADNDLFVDLGYFAQAKADKTFLDMLEATGNAGRIDDLIGSVLVFRAVLERVPRASQECVPPIPTEEIVDLMTTLLTNGFFAHNSI